MRLSKDVTDKRSIKNFEGLEERLHVIHSNKYDYSSSVYVGNRHPITVVCKVHGEFTQNFGQHYNKAQGCQECAKIQKGVTRSANIAATWVQRANVVHNNKYDYSKFVYTKTHLKAIFICPTHGEFVQKIAAHIKGSGCPDCQKERQYNSAEHVMVLFKEKHGDTYDYTNFKLVDMSTKAEIICKTHGSFMQTPSSHSLGRGCPTCAKYRRLWSRDYYQGKPTVLYYISLPFGMFKIGITTQSIHERFRREHEISYSVVKSWEFEDGGIAHDLESLCLGATKGFQYTGEDIIRGGNTEIRTRDVLSTIETIIGNYNETTTKLPKTTG